MEKPGWYAESKNFRIVLVPAIEVCLILGNLLHGKNLTERVVQGQDCESYQLCLAPGTKGCIVVEN